MAREEPKVAAPRHAMIAHGPDANRDAVAGDPLGRDCFLCREPLTRFPVVVWHGSSGAISLHVDCASELGVSLQLDAWAARATL